MGKNDNRSTAIDGRPRRRAPSSPHFKLSALAFTIALALPAPSVVAQQPQRLSEWLAQHGREPDAYLLGLSWRVPDETGPQSRLHVELLSALSGHDKTLRADPVAMARLRAWLQTLPITGRVPVALADVHWLQANPARDPVLLPGHTVDLPRRPATVTLLRSDGTPCVLPHQPGAEAAEYVRRCGVAGADWVWIAQPDGRVQRFGIATWNRQAQDLPAPGAWLWAPSRESGFTDGFSDRLIAFLATQGPAIDAASRLPPPASQQDSSSLLTPHSSPDLRATRSRSAEFSASDWGNVGLLQTPTARMFEPGHFWFHLSRTYPQTRGNVFLQPFEWMEAGFRYVDISNRAYGPTELSGDQSYKDKSIDLKLRLWSESAYAPQVAIGLRDVAGTGLFSGEYLVASKRTDTLDWSLGIGWGYVGARGDLRNPLGVVSSKYDRRPSVDVGQGGNFALSSYFRGPAALFGGVQWQTPWERWIAKVEYDGNDYQHEPQSNNQKQDTPFNFGVVYRAGKAVDLSLGLERGNRVMLGVTLRSQLDGLYTPKLNDPPRVPVVASRPARPADWTATSRDIRTQTDWHVSAIEQRGRELRLTVDDAAAVYWRERLDRAAAVVHRDAPANVDRFTFTYRDRGREVAEHVVERDTWVKEQTQPLPPSQQRASVMARAVSDTDGKRGDAVPGAVVYSNPQARFEHGLGLNYIQTIGGPDGFVLYQISAVERAKFRFTEDTWLQGAVRLRLTDNYDKFRYTAPSNLPRVRTFLREYLTTSTVTLPNLQLSHTGDLAPNQYYSLYGGFLEEMFAGVGGEWLYRPFGSSVAYGIDVNQVKQRAFEQDFAFRDYKVTTGHATLYWETGWNDVLLFPSVGKYLAGDIGVTLGASRTFKNGVSIGAFATKTNVSKEQFGEGSFDKGIFVSIPFDAFLTKSSNTTGTFLWKPLTRDGGAKLARSLSLYDVTRARADRTLRTQPAAPPNEATLPSDRKEPWTPEVNIQAPHVPIAPQAKTIVWGDGATDTRELVQALYHQDFRDIAVEHETTHRLTVTVSNERVRPVSRAVALAARTALRLAPLDTREIRVRFIERTVPAVTYDFIDLRRLERYLGGGLDDAAFAPYVVVDYQNPAAIQKNPLAGFQDLDRPQTAPAITNPFPETFSVGRVARDYVAAGQALGDVNWLGAGAYAAGAILGSSLLDRRAYTFAQDNKSAGWMTNGIRVGNALPWLGLLGSGATALAATDPQLSRTSYAATEAGMAALLVATGLKMGVGRARPDAGQGKTTFETLSSDDRYNAFPSRHSAVAWAVATPYALEYDAKWAYGLAGLTNLARIGSREHWVSDTVAGSLLGYGLGWMFWQSGRNQGKYDARVVLQPKGVGVVWQTP